MKKLAILGQFCCYCRAQDVDPVSRYMSDDWELMENVCSAVYTQYYVGQTHRSTSFCKTVHSQTQSPRVLHVQNDVSRPEEAYMISYGIHTSPLSIQLFEF